MYIPKYFKFTEFIKTNEKVENYPLNFEHLQNLVELSKLLDGVRASINAPIIINSAYRTELVNKNVGGVRNSLHLCGRACDIWSPIVSGRALFDRLCQLHSVIAFGNIAENDDFEIIYYPNKHFTHFAFKYKI